jgi:hypothetical protein
MLQFLTEMGYGITTKLEINPNSGVHGLKVAHLGVDRKAKALAFFPAPFESA